MTDMVTGLLAVDIVRMLDPNMLMTVQARQDLRTRLRQKGKWFCYRFRKRLMRQERERIMAGLGPEKPGEHREIKKLRRRITQALTRSCQ